MTWTFDGKQYEQKPTVDYDDPEFNTPEFRLKARRLAIAMSLQQCCHPDGPPAPNDPVERARLLLAWAETPWPAEHQHRWALNPGYGTLECRCGAYRYPPADIHST